MRIPPLLATLVLGCTTTGLPGGMSSEPPPGREVDPPSFAVLAPLSAPAAKSPVLAAMEAELARARVALWEQPSAPHFLAYTATDQVSTRIQARDGALEAAFSDHTRQLATVVRVGTPAFDSGRRRERDYRRTDLPIDDDPAALRLAIWRDTQRAYRASLATFRKLEAARTKEGGPPAGPDFSPQPGVVHLEPPVALEVDVAAWQARLRRLSARLRQKERAGFATLVVEVATRWVATSEGTRTQTVRPLVRVVLGGEVEFEGRSSAELPGEVELLAAVDAMAERARIHAGAPRVSAWRGPVLFEPAAAAQWLHEVLGHRLEGARQDDDDHARILFRQQGQQILPAYLTMFDDPLLERLGTQRLGGAYRVDDEGMPARRVTLVEDGILRALLVGRVPVAGFDRPDGHGRWRGFGPATGRQANLVLVTRVGASPRELRERLLAEVLRQKLAFGMVVHEADGLFEPPMNRQPAQFGLRLPRMSRVYVDGRPDEPVTAAVLGGRLLDSPARIIGAGDDYRASNFGCLGDSGFVPVSTTSPSLLFSDLRIEPSQHYRDRR